MQKVLFIILLFSQFVFANTPPPSSEPIPTNTAIEAYRAASAKEANAQFDIKEAYRIFDETNLKLSTQNLDIHELNHAIKLFKKLNNQAQECIELTQKRLDNINSLMQLATPITDPNAPTQALTADQKYVRKESKDLTNRQAQCRLFTIKATEVIARYQSVVAEIKKVETFSQSSPAWEYLPKSIEHWKNGDLFKHQLTLEEFQFHWKQIAINAIISILLSVIILWQFTHINYLKRIFRLKNDYMTWGFTLFLSLWFVINWGWCEFHEILQATDAHLCSMFKLMSIFSCLLFLNSFVFSIKRVRALFYWYQLDFNYFYVLINTIICLSTVLKVTEWFKYQLLPLKMTLHVAQSLFLFLNIFISIYLVFSFIKKHIHYQWIKNHQKGLKVLNIIYGLTCILCNISGYHILAMRLFYSSLTIISIIFILALMVQALQKLYALLLTQPLYDKIRYVFGYKEHQNLIEFLMLKYSLQIIVISYGLYLIGENMGYVSFYVTKFYQPLLDGLEFGNFTIYPARSVLGIIIFSLIFLLCRAISTVVTRFHQFNDEEDTQVAIASILNYIGFTIALVTGLLISGFNFTGLAIVAGALSVGIGLGLQSIVNNFVSGLILLIEKPIKPGDRIIVDGVEGTVKKIRVRSTQILTPAREDIIVPNSDLVTRRVTNYMYTDKYLSVSCQVPVPYDCDINLITELLLKAAYSHEEVIKTTRNKPNVLLKSFGDYSLNFQLWCLIKDANKKSIVTSDLNYMILKLFKEHKIEIPIPQQNLYLHHDA
jgi:potassium efflux system protein